MLRAPGVMSTHMQACKQLADRVHADVMSAMHLVQAWSHVWSVCSRVCVCVRFAHMSLHTHMHRHASSAIFRET